MAEKALSRRRGLPGNCRTSCEMICLAHQIDLASYLPQWGWSWPGSKSGGRQMPSSPPFKAIQVAAKQYCGKTAPTQWHCRHSSQRLVLLSNVSSGGMHPPINMPFPKCKIVTRHVWVAAFFFSAGGRGQLPTPCKILASRIFSYELHMSEEF